jgi:CheY-like chemotaxis protein
MRVLLIDDNADSLRRTSQELGARGILCEPYTSAVSAVFAFAFGGVSFDAVVANYVMQGMDGMAVLRVVRNLSPHMPVLLVAEDENPGMSQSQADALVQGGRARAVDVVTRGACLAEAVGRFAPGPSASVV